MSESPDRLTARIAVTSDVPRIGAAARQTALSAGFASEDAEEIAVVVTELATNLLRHAGNGSITLSSLQEGERTGILIESEDEGPGIPDVEQAMTDGFSTAGGLGIGLGTVNRLMDEVDIYSGSAGGLHLACRRWARSRAAAIFRMPVAFGVATRSRRSFEKNGDSFIIKQWDGNALAGVIDGLGHGPLAHRASQAARQYIERHYDQPLLKLFQGVDRACRATRGVVMALVRFDFRAQQFTVASVGNIETRLVGSPGRFHPVVRRGIVGMNAPQPVCNEHPWDAANILVMHSDGLHTRWDWSEFNEVASSAPGVIAQKLLQVLGKADDDATVLVVRSANG